MKFRRIKKIKKVNRPWVIYWNDCRGFIAKTWYDKSDRKPIRKTAEAQFESTGWLIDETKHCYVFAAERYPTGGGWNYGSIFSIPKGSILKMAQDFTTRKKQ